MEILLGGLISILTLIVSKFYELKQKRLEHTYAIDSLFVSRKLDAAENAIMVFTK